MDNLDELIKVLNKQKSLKTLADTAGGEVLIKEMIAEIATAVESLSTNYKEVSDAVIRATLAKINVLLNITDVLVGAKARKEMLEKEVKELMVSE
jgi:uncharacterized hydantoinase/oxoprolinase family protein